MTKFSTISDSSKGILFASLTALLWGFLAIALKVAVKYIDPTAVAWFRFSFAFTALFILISIRNRKGLELLLRPPLLAIVAGIGLGLNYVFYIKGLDLTSPSNAQIIIQIAPISLAIVGLTIFKEKLNRIQLVGFAIAIAGFILFYRDQLSNLFAGADTYNTGTIMVVGAAFSWVFYAASQKFLVKKHNAQSLNLIIFLLPTLFLIPFISFSEFQGLSVGIWALLAFLGLNTVIAYGSLAEAFKYLDANKVGVIITLNPMITIAIMLILTAMEVTWIAPEKISIYGVLGALLVVVGAILAVKSKK